MASAIMPQLGREVTIEACGRKWTLARMEIDRLEEFIDWLRPQLPDPFAGLEKILPSMSREDALKEIKEARAAAIMDYDSPAIQSALTTVRGRLRMFYLCLRVNHPEIKLADAFAIVTEMGEKEIERALAAASGTAGKKKDQEAVAAAPSTGASSFVD
jgi:hypothetical protein